jgi:hypothetical protein
LLDQGGLPDQVKTKSFDYSSNLAIRAWNTLGGRIDWIGIDVVSELLGIEDIEMLIAQLETIRDHG